MTHRWDAMDMNYSRHDQPITESSLHRVKLPSSRSAVPLLPQTVNFPQWPEGGCCLWNIWRLHSCLKGREARGSGTYKPGFWSRPVCEVQASVLREESASGLYFNYDTKILWHARRKTFSQKRMIHRFPARRASKLSFERFPWPLWFQRKPSQRAASLNVLYKCKCIL